MTTTLLPAIFVGHGSPMNTLESNRYTEAWQNIATSLPKPKAILMISAHWYINATAVTAMQQPRTIHDFYGFPDELFAVQYPAPGDAVLAQRVAELAAPTWVGMDTDQWGLDHGAWSVLVHMYPDADVPVVQLSINANEQVDFHSQLGERLAPLLHEGVLIIASGNVVHNLGRIQWGLDGQGFDWADSFDAAARELMMNNPSEISSLRNHDSFQTAVPTPEHFLPLTYIAGIAAATDATMTVFNDERTMGSLSMTSYIAQPKQI
jgi:4,5-DOPA dioxygenase extradiol